jgi:ribonuclease HI
VNLDSPSGELAAAIYALQKFRQYVGYDEFDLITDSSTVKALQSQNKISGKLARWAVLLSEFKFHVIHKAGSTLHNADRLSRSN